MKTVAIACFAVALLKVAMVTTSDLESSLYQEITMCKGTIDQKFVMQLNEAGLAEVALGRLAYEKASSGQVKELARKLVDDYTRANEELKAIATSMGIVLPAECFDCQQKMIDLEKLNGKEFDRKFVEIFLADHNEVLGKFSSELTQGRDVVLKGWASKQLTVLQGQFSLSLASQNF